jgi:hypothetical protein
VEHSGDALAPTYKLADVKLNGGTHRGYTTVAPYTRLLMSDCTADNIGDTSLLYKLADVKL